MLNYYFERIKRFYSKLQLIFKCDDFYHLNDEGGIIYNDLDISIS